MQESSRWTGNNDGKPDWVELARHAEKQDVALKAIEDACAFGSLNISRKVGTDEEIKIEKAVEELHKTRSDAIRSLLLERVPGLNYDAESTLPTLTAKYRYLMGKVELPEALTQSAEVSNADDPAQLVARADMQQMRQTIDGMLPSLGRSASR